MAGQAVKPFELVAGSVALDLVNTLDFRFRPSGPEEFLRSYGDLLRFVVQAGLLSGERARRLRRAAAAAGQAESVRLLAEVKKLREALAAVAYALVEEREVPAEKLQVLQKYFKQAGARRSLSAVEGRLGWTWGAMSGDVAAPLWLLVGEAEDLLLSERTERLRDCASETCRWLFLDTSKNHTRRWCDMKLCGNRMKARRFQARLANG